MDKIIYHGSDHIIERPQYCLGKSYNDYGIGFYCTEERDMAMEWAAYADRDGYANQYRIRCNDLMILNLGASEYTMLHWLTILLENRTFDTQAPLATEARAYLLHNFHIDHNDVDIIIGYRADDSYFSFANDFINGTISYRQLCNAMRLGRLGEQIVLKSRKAFRRLEFLDAIHVDRRIWYERRFERDQTARRQYLDEERGRRKRGDLYITTILDEEMQADDPRLR